VEGADTGIARGAEASLF